MNENELIDTTIRRKSKKLWKMILKEKNIGKISSVYNRLYVLWKKRFYFFWDPVQICV